MRWTAPHKASRCRRVIVDDGRDRNRPRLAVGKGFPFPLFRLRNGFTVSPWRTFAEAPLESRTARFPGSGSKPWRVTIGLPKAWRGLNAGSYPPPPLLVCLQPRLLEPSSAYVPVLSSRPPRRPRRPPSVQSPFAQLGCYLRWGDVDRLLGGSYPSVVARTGSCVAPVGLSPPSVFSLVWRVLAGCYQSLLPTAAFRVGRNVPSLPLTDPDVQNSRFRFFTGELRSQRCSDGRSGLLVGGAASGGR